MMYSLYHCIIFVQFCDFNRDPALVCKEINDLEAVKENFDSFGEHTMYGVSPANCYSPSTPPLTDTASLYSIM